MYAFHEPTVSMNVVPNTDSDAFAMIQEQLSAFGLNPRDWLALRDSPSELPRLVRARLILVHREDNELRLGVNIRAATADNPRPAITDIEMMLI